MDEIRGAGGKVRVKGPVGLGEDVDEVGSGGGQLVVDGPGGSEDGGAAAGAAGFGEGCYDVADQIRVEGLEER